MTFNERDMKAWMVGGLDGDAAAHLSMLGALVPILRDFYQSNCENSKVEALVQDTLMAVHERRATFDRNQCFREWVLAIAEFKLASYRRASAGAGERFSGSRDDNFAPQDVLEADHTDASVVRDVVRYPGGLKTRFVNWARRLVR